MRLILIALLFICFSAKSQVPFVLGKSYPIGYVVSYPTWDIQWISKTATVAKTYPAEGKVWTRHNLNPVPESTPISNVNRASIDSLYRQINETNAQFAALSALLVKTRASLDSISKSNSDTSSYFNIKYSLYGVPLINMINRNTGVIRGLEAGEGIILEPLENTIKINRLENTVKTNRK